MRIASVSKAGHFSSLILLAALAACVSTQDRFTRAFEAEQDGDLYRAARAYAEVLRRDPDFRDARRRFEDTARDAADSLYVGAARDGQRERYGDAVQKLDDLAALRVLAGEFGVALPLPDGYEARYAAMSENAVRALLRDAERNAERGRFEQADDAYAAAYRYPMPAALRDDLDARRVRTLLGWSQSRLRDGGYRQAFSLAERVRAFDPPPPGDTRRQAEAVQREALDAGTERVAFLPLVTARTDAPAYWTDAVTRALTEAYWADPPLFVEAVPPTLLRRELGRMGRRDAFSRSEAVGIGRALDATLVFAPALTAYTREERGRKETARAIQTRDGRDTTYAEVRYTLVLEAEASFRLIDSSTRNVLAETKIPARVSRDVRFATYAGDVTTLKMPSSSVRDLFDEGERRAVERDLDGELQEALASALAQAAFEAILRQVP